jgi:hypothetical protein
LPVAERRVIGKQEGVRYSYDLVTGEC